MSQQREPANPFYLLLLIVGFCFVMTALAYAVVPTLEEKARNAGAEVPNAPWQQALREDGWRWLLVEVAAMIILGLASMGLDRLRSLQKEKTSATIPPNQNSSHTPDSG